MAVGIKFFQSPKNRRSRFATLRGKNARPALACSVVNARRSTTGAFAAEFRISLCEMRRKNFLNKDFILQRLFKFPLQWFVVKRQVD